MLFYTITDENIEKLREKARNEEDEALASLREFVANEDDILDSWGLFEKASRYVQAMVRRRYLESHDPKGNALRYIIEYPRESQGSNVNYRLAKLNTAEALMDIARAEQTLTIER